MSSPPARHPLGILPAELWSNIFDHLTPPYALPGTKAFDIFLLPHFPTYESIIESTAAKHALLLTCRGFHAMLLRDLYTIIPLSTVSQAVSLLRVAKSSRYHADLLRNETRRLDFCISGRDNRHEGREGRRLDFQANIHVVVGPIIELVSYFGGLHHLTLSSSVYDRTTSSLQELRASMDMRDALERLCCMETLRSLQADSIRHKSLTTLPAFHTLTSSKIIILQALRPLKAMPALSSVILGPCDDSRDLKTAHLMETMINVARIHRREIETIESLALLSPVPFALLHSILHLHVPNLRHLIMDPSLVRDSDLPPAAFDAETLDLNTVGLYRCKGHTDTPVDWEGILEFASRLFTSSDNDTSKNKSIRLLSPDLRESLRSDPNVLASFVAGTVALGVTIEDDMGRVVTPGPAH